jgi:hypothetical protein
LKVEPITWEHGQFCFNRSDLDGSNVLVGAEFTDEGYKKFAE